MLFKSWGLTIASFVLGIFMDLDHVLDYFFNRGFRFNLNGFFRYFDEERHQKLTLIFHSWEWLFVMLGIAQATGWNPWATGFLIGYAHHMLFDIIFNHPNLKGLSLIWRYRKNFDSEAIYPKDRVGKKRTHIRLDS